MSQIYFISDLHVTSMQDNKAQDLLRFLFSLQPTDTLFLNGDIFDLWLGDHEYFINKFRPIVDALTNFTKQGGKLHYFEGNHDLHLTKFWHDVVGANVHSGPEVFLFDQTVVRVEHGDEMDPEDQGYIFLRWFLRTWVLERIILNLPGFVVAFIGEQASRMSRSYTNNKRDEERIVRVIHTHALKKFDERPFDAIITGHVHLLDEFHFQKGDKIIKSFNLGSWDQKPIILKLSQNNWSWQ